MHKYNNNNNILKSLSFIFICSIFNTGYSQTFQADSVFTSPGIIIPNKATGTTPPPATFPTQDISSKPITTSYSCEAYRGQYDIDSQAIGVFKITREGNSLNKYYGQIIGTDNSGCYQACTPKTTTDLQSCESVNGAGWTGNYTTTTPFTCSAGGYLQQGTKSTSNNCAAPPPPPLPPEPPAQNLYYGNSYLSGLCSAGGCQTNYGAGVTNDVLKAAGVVASKNADLRAVIDFLYDSCPLGSNWSYVRHLITIGPVTGSCETDRERFTYHNKTARSTVWNLRYNGIPM